MYILGIWDGHDCGAAIVEGKQIKAAVNEERYTKRKLEVGFPKHSIRACLDILNIGPEDIKHIAVTTTDFAKTLTRVFPGLKENYYLFRRRKTNRPRLENLRRHVKYKVTEWREKPGCKTVSGWYFKKEFKKLGFENFELYFVDHHSAHAASAAFCSGFKDGLVITLDGVGDGLSGTVNIFDNGGIERLSKISAKDSLGIFFEQVTNLLGMRELEDEGKVMALSDYAYPVPDEKNPMLKLFDIKGIEIKSNYSAASRYKALRNLLWNTPREQFAYMAQRTMEYYIVKLFENALNETKMKNVAWSGGVASNIKANMQIRHLNSVKKWFVFPHMGDGGLAAGAALYLNFKLTGINDYQFNDVFLGPEYSQEEIKQVLDKHKLEYERKRDIAKCVGDLVSEEKFVLWYQGRMEFGPRALGNRSIVAPAFSIEIKDKLNLQIKKRNWFQPFCPSLLKEESKKFFSDIKGYDRFMTMGYKTKKKVRERVKAVVNVDGSARPQMLGKENPLYRKMIERVKKRTGDGIILNTSFNLHGFPIVNTPEDAVDVMLKTKTPYLAIGDYLVKA
jgi:carbamoyltransferase